MRIAAISDIHGNSVALEAVLHAVSEQLKRIDLPMAKLMAKRVLVGKMLRP